MSLVYRLAILFYALVYDDDDEDDSGLSSDAVTNFKSWRHMSGAKCLKKFFVVPSTFWLYKYNQSFW